MKNNELYHYGVLGMKLGVHKNPKQATADKYQRKADKDQTKANKYKVKYEQRQADESAAKARYAKAQRKAEKWTRAMNKTFAGMDVNNLPDTTVNAGKNYVNKRIYV